MEAAEALKAEGNTFFSDGNFLKAAGAFTKALKTAPVESPLHAALLANRCAALLKLNKHAKALADADACIEHHPEYAKGHYRRGETLQALGRDQEAAEAFAVSTALNPELACEDPALIAKTAADPIIFAKAVMQLLQTAYASEGKVEASVYFAGLQNSIVGCEEAWSDQDKLIQGTAFLRQQVIDRQQPFLCLVVPREVICFPEVWEGKPKSMWSFSDQAGVFVQLESAETRRVWYLAIRKKDNTLQDGVMLDEKAMCVMDPLYWNEKNASIADQPVYLEASCLDAKGKAFSGKNRAKAGGQKKSSGSGKAKFK